MSATIEGALTDRIGAILADIVATEAARLPIEAEVQAELARLDALAARAEATAPSFWLSPNPAFNVGTFNGSIIAALMLVSPAETRKVVTARVKQRASQWRGLRLAPADKARRLTKLATDLRIARAKLEQRRREIEQLTGEVQPRTGPLDHPEIWLMVPAELDVAAGNGRGKMKITHDDMNALAAGSLFTQLRAAANAERQRAIAILGVCREAGRSDLASHYIAEGIALDTVRSALVAAAPKPAGNPAPVGFDPAWIMRELARKPTLQ